MGFEHAAHLREGEVRTRQVQQPEADRHGVERGVWHGQRRSVTLDQLHHALRVPLDDGLRARGRLG